MSNYDVIVIGQGYAGLKAANLAAARDLRTATVEEMFAGGLVMSINELHPAPDGGEPCGPVITGDLAYANTENGIENISGSATSLQREGGLWRVDTDAGVHTAANVIIASGARLKTLGVPGEAELTGLGVSHCADCDGPMYMNKEGVIIGGGDSAFQEAVALAAYVSKVTIIMRGPASRARPDLIDAVARHPKIVVLPNTTVTAILGTAETGVTGVSLSGEHEGEAPCSVIFVFVGLQPNTDFLPDEVARDESGAVVTTDNLQTNLPGLWAIGHARSGFGGLLSQASSEAARVVAAL